MIVESSLILKHDVDVRQEKILLNDNVYINHDFTSEAIIQLCLSDARKNIILLNGDLQCDADRYWLCLLKEGIA